MDKSFIALVRLGINKPVEWLPNSFNWKSIYTLASEQGLLAIVLDGIERIPERLRPP